MKRGAIIDRVGRIFERKNVLMALLMAILMVGSTMFVLPTTVVAANTFDLVGTDLAPANAMLKDALVTFPQDKTKNGYTNRNLVLKANDDKTEVAR